LVPVQVNADALKSRPLRETKNPLKTVKMLPPKGRKRRKITDDLQLDQGHVLIREAKNDLSPNDESFWQKFSEELSDLQENNNNDDDNNVHFSSERVLRKGASAIITNAGLTADSGQDFASALMKRGLAGVNRKLNEVDRALHLSDLLAKDFTEEKPNLFYAKRVLKLRTSKVPKRWTQPKFLRKKKRPK